MPCPVPIEFGCCDGAVTTWEFRYQFHPGALGFQDFLWQAGQPHPHLYSRAHDHWVWLGGNPPPSDAVGNLDPRYFPFTDSITGLDLAQGRPVPEGTITATAFDSGFTPQRYRHTGDLSLLVPDRDLGQEISDVRGLLEFPREFVPFYFVQSALFINQEFWLDWYGSPDRGGIAPRRSVTGNGQQFLLYGSQARASGDGSDYQSSLWTDAPAFFFAERDESGSKDVGGLGFNHYAVLADCRLRNESGHTMYGHFYGTGISRSTDVLQFDQDRWLRIVTPGTYEQTIVAPAGEYTTFRRNTNGYVRVTESASP